ncbi:MAG: hypothetical protein K9K36_07150 [Desulfarculaceae bacterium]|nr:hypothetical protein [Desulfarculaceae bacterium]MCF8124503.1 hypothetical protein [Desulfarculaceae bacterium]
MSDPRELAEALRPRVRELAQELAPQVRRAMIGQLGPHFFEGCVVLCLEGILRDELVRALDTEERGSGGMS